MPTVLNPTNLEYQSDAAALESFDLRTITPRLSQIVGSKHLVFDMRSLEAGKYSFPYHFHHNAEEFVMIQSGSMTIRTPKGLEVVSQGQMVFFEMGASGAHQFFNHQSTPCTYLDIRTTLGMDVAEYPDSGKINISPLKEIYEKSSQVDYNKGEEHIKQIWDKLR